VNSYDFYTSAIDWINEQRSLLYQVNKEDYYYYALLNDIGRFYEEIDLKYDAVEIYKQAIEEQPAHSSAYFNLIHLYLNMRLPENALALVQQFEENALDNPPEETIGNTKLSQIPAILESEFDIPPLLSAKIRCYVQLNDAQSAARYVNLALKIEKGLGDDKDGKWMRIGKSVAAYYASVGDGTSALHWYNRYCKAIRNSRSPLSAYDYAVPYLIERQFSKAGSLFEKNARDMLFLSSSNKMDEKFPVRKRMVYKSSVREEFAESSLMLSFAHFCEGDRKRSALIFEQASLNDSIILERQHVFASLVQPEWEQYNRFVQRE